MYKLFKYNKINVSLIERKFYLKKKQEKELVDMIYLKINIIT